MTSTSDSAEHPTSPRPLRCAIYTRKSTEDGLNQPFNTLEAQREAAEAYILSQRHAGWTVVAERYDDGGVNGGALLRLRPLRHYPGMVGAGGGFGVDHPDDPCCRFLHDFVPPLRRFLRS